VNIKKCSFAGFICIFLFCRSADGKRSDSPVSPRSTISLKVLSNERGQSRCHLTGEKELFGSLVYVHLPTHRLQPESLVWRSKYWTTIHQAVLIGDRIRSVLIFFSWEKKIKKAASLLCLSFSPQRVARLSPVCHQPHI